jgi:hypothetical protein
VDDERVAEEIFREQGAHQPSATKTSSTAATAARNGGGDKISSSTASTNGGELDRWADIYEDMPMRRKMALYDYDPRELSPNVDSEVELSFRTGDIITIYGEMDDDGFYMGELHGSRGLVPSNFLTDIPVGLDEKMMIRHLQLAGGLRPPVAAIAGGYAAQSRGIKPAVATSRW